MNVQDVMTRNVKFSRVEATLADAARIMAENNCGTVPIVDDTKRVIGIVTDRDICLAMANTSRLPSQIPVEHVMATTVYMCRPEDELETALQTMRDQRVRRLPVVGTDGTLRGILSVDDVVLRAQGHKRDEQGTELGPDKTVKTLKAIFKRPSLRKPLPAQP